MTARRAAAAAAAALAVLAGLAAGRATADIALALPVTCADGVGCFIQQYVDHDPGPGHADHRCGGLSYDGHEGTDFAVPTLADMDRGVAVVAAAPGQVRAVRDGMPDIATGTPGAPDVTGRGCGNGVLVDHAGGWQTQYCHLRAGSVAVAPGDTVAAGARLGDVGLSGNTQFPHLELVVRRDGRAVDPFAPGGAPACDAAPGPTLWQDPPDYRPGALIGAGIADAIPEWEAIKAGLPEPALQTGAPALVVWAHGFGGRAGDTVTFALRGPGGMVAEGRATLERDQAQYFRATGRRAGAGGWPAGRYVGEIALIRDGAVIDRRSATATIRD